MQKQIEAVSVPVPLEVSMVSMEEEEKQPEIQPGKRENKKEAYEAEESPKKKEVIKET